MFIVVYVYLHNFLRQCKIPYICIVEILTSIWWEILEHPELC